MTAGLDRARWSALVAVAALGVSTYTLVNQLPLNAYAKERHERRHSSRVVVWAVAGDGFSSIRPAGLDVSIQNRSPVPVRHVRVYAELIGRGVAAADLPDLPPCATEMHRIAPPPGGAFVQAGYSRVRLEFAVDDRGWTVTADGLTEIDRWSGAPGGRLRDQRSESGTAADCGEGG